MDVFTIGIWRFLRIMFVLLASTATETTGFSFTNTPYCPSPAKTYKTPMAKDLVIDCRTTDPSSTSKLYFKSRFNFPLRYLSKGSVYTIPKFSFLTTGMYKCEAENPSGQKITWECQIEPSRAKFYYPEIQSRRVYLAGQSFNISCSVEFERIDPLSVNIEFYKDASAGLTKLPNSGVIRNINTVSASLLFKNSSAMPPTIYKCVAMAKVDGRQQRKETQTSIAVKDPVFPKITSFPPGKFIVLKSSKEIHFPCSASGFPSPLLTWYKNKQPLFYTYPCKQAGNSICYNIKSPTYPNDEGNYTCVAKNNLGTTTKTVTAVFQFRPQIENSIKDVVVQGLKEQRLTCKVTNVKGQMVPTFKWVQKVCTTSLKDCGSKWQPIKPDHKQYPAPNVPTLTSKITVPRSVLIAVYYKCIAATTLGQDRHVIKFHRSRVYQPKVEIKGSDTFNAEETVHITCIVSYGNFTRWLDKNGQTLSSSLDPRVSVVIRREGDFNEVATLSITNATTSDSGLYTCKGKAIDGSKLNETKLITVKALLAPNITSLGNITAYHYRNNETNIQLTCHVTGNPPPRVTWTKLGSSLPALKEKKSCKDIIRGYYVKKTAKGNVLLICDASNRHSGWYTCHADNSEGTDKKRAYIDVLTAPRINTKSLYNVQYTSTGESIDLKCQATGNPQPVVVWTKQYVNGSTISWPGQGLSYVKIQELDTEDYGNYTCTATNSRGSATMVIDVRKPVAPYYQQRSDNKTLIIATAVGGSLGLIFLIAVLACCLVNRRQKRLLEEYKAIKYLRKGEDYKLDPDRTILEQCEDLPYDADWEFPDKRLILQGVVGSGTFGQVMKAEAIGILSFSARDKTSNAFKRRSRMRRRLSSSRIYQDSAGVDYTRTTVAVKTLKADASENDYKDLATELKVMIHLGEHTNIINLLGACTRTKQLMVIMEFAPHGNLLNFLRSRREIYEATWRKTANNPDAEFTLADLVMYSYQIARGMDFLSSKKCVHRDLAARNVLIGEDYVMKIADFGLARDIYKTDIYVKETTGLLPVKWMAPESLFDRVYTQKTDVWSFGVLLWETQTLGGTPYPGVPVEDLMDYLSEGKRMRQPADCPPEIYAIMRDCWMQKPTERPTFSELVRRIERIIEKQISGQESEDAYISVFMDEDLHRIYYLEPKDTFKHSAKGNSTCQDEHLPMTDEEIKTSPLPPVPCLSLENIYKPNEDNPYYCDPVDSRPDVRYVQSPSSPSHSNKKRTDNKFNFHGHQSRNPMSSLPSDQRFDIHREKRISEGSTGVESGIDMDESYPSDHSLGRRGYAQTDDGAGISFLDSSIVKENTRETML